MHLPERRAHCHTPPPLSKRERHEHRLHHRRATAVPGRTGPLRGTVTVPGDKSISHRALMFGALAVGETVIDGLLEGEDVLATAAALTAMGADIDQAGARTGTSMASASAACCNRKRRSTWATAAPRTRLLMGLVASHPITATFVGDASPVAPADGPRHRSAVADGSRVSPPVREAACR